MSSARFFRGDKLTGTGMLHAGDVLEFIVPVAPGESPLTQLSLAGIKKKPDFGDTIKEHERFIVKKMRGGESAYCIVAPWKVRPFDENQVPMVSEPIDKKIIMLKILEIERQLADLKIYLEADK